MEKHLLAYKIFLSALFLPKFNKSGYILWNLPFSFNIVEILPCECVALSNSAFYCWIMCDGSHLTLTSLWWHFFDDYWGIYVAAVRLLSCVRLFAAPRPAAHQAPLSFIISQSLLKLMSIESVMPSNHLILCHSLLLLPSSFPASGSFPRSQLLTSGGQSIGGVFTFSSISFNLWKSLRNICFAKQFLISSRFRLFFLPFPPHSFINLFKNIYWTVAMCQALF